MLNLFQNVRGVKVLLSEKKDGNMKLFSSGFEKNRERFLSKNELNYDDLVSAKLGHGNNVVIIKNQENKFIDYCDGLISNNKEVVLGVTSADCLPIFLFDSKEKVAGILHCGWKSLSKGLIESSIEVMIKNFKSDPKNILIGIGPGIGKCHFEIENDLLLRFVGYEEFVVRDGEKIFLDLAGIAKAKFIETGIREENIEIDERCTVCNENLWSYRRDGLDEDENVQAMVAIIKIN